MCKHTLQHSGLVLRSEKCNFALATPIPNRPTVKEPLEFISSSVELSVNSLGALIVQFSRVNSQSYLLLLLPIMILSSVVGFEPIDIHMYRFWKLVSFEKSKF